VDRQAALVIHEIPLERRTLHGHFSRELAPILTVDDGDSVRFSTLDSGWHLSLADDPPSPRFEPRHEELDAGHALIGPIDVRGARAGGTLAVRVDELRVGAWGFTFAGGWSTPLNDYLGLGESAPEYPLKWTLDADSLIGRDRHGRQVELRPFLGVIGMPPPEAGIHPTGPPRRWGGNIDCTELVVGSTLYLPIPVDGALVSAGDGHARQGDGEVSQLAIECPMDEVQLTLSLVDLELENPIARVGDAWITFGFDEDLDVAAYQAVAGMLDLMKREHGLDRQDALALASVVVDLRVTQIVNGVKGVHAVLRRDAFREATITA
jgi:acetamidase/formamidase